MQTADRTDSFSLGQFILSPFPGINPKQAVEPVLVRCRRFHEVRVHQLFENLGYFIVLLRQAEEHGSSLEADRGFLSFPQAK
jgi:hypothetical protein